MNASLETIILNSIHGPGSIHSVELIQPLWGGYGELLRVYLSEGTLVVKYVDWDALHQNTNIKLDSVSHQRKVRSYEVEAAWYKQYSTERGVHKIPKVVAAKGDQHNHVLILEDLRESGFRPVPHAEDQHVRMGLSWLARMHATFLGRAPVGLWETGTYWHLATRPDELAKTRDPDLKKFASIVDQRLASSPYQTIVHGDSKLANFLFTHDDVAAVDFQYVGGGVGIKDLCYFLSSIYFEDELFEVEDELLSYYFDQLHKRLQLSKSSVDSHALESSWRELYPLAWFDFYRFLSGWNPDHKKITPHLKRMKQRVIACL